MRNFFPFCQLQSATSAVKLFLEGAVDFVEAPFADRYLQCDVHLLQVGALGVGWIFYSKSSNIIVLIKYDGVHNTRFGYAKSHFYSQK